MRIDSSWASAVEQVATSLVMSCFMSFVMLAVNQGIMDGFFGLWIKTWAIAFIVALPTSIVVAPRIKQLVMRFH